MGTKLDLNPTKAVSDRMKKVKSLVVEDQKMIEGMENMDSRDRETVIKQVERLKKDITADEQK